jgi:hypothetical protein
MQAHWKCIKIVTVILFIVLCFAPKQAVGLQGSSSFPIQATGSIDSSNQTGENLIINPDFSQGETGWDFHHYVSPQYIFIDTTQNHNGVPSARLDPTAYIDRSIWPSYRVAVTPGQTVVASCWAMVGPNANGPDGLGARLGIDGWNALYGGSDNDVLGHATTSSYLLWSNVNTWVQLTLNYTVLPGDAAVVPWVQGFTHDANESVWVTDFELYVY